MSVFLILAAATSTGESNPLVRIVITASAVVITSLVLSSFFGRRSRASVKVATNGNENAYTVTLSPAPVLVESIGRIRALYGETGAAPRITRMMRPVVSVTTTGVTIAERKLGTVLSIPASDIVSVKAGPSRVTFAAPKYPSVWIALRHGDTEDHIALPPLLGGSQTINVAMARKIEVEISTALGLIATEL